MAILVVGVVLLYVLVCVLAVLVILLYRQFGLVYVGSKRSYEMPGPPVGAKAPTGLRVVKPDSAGASLALDWSALQPAGVTRLLLSGEACPVCEHLLHHLDDELSRVLDPIRVLFVDSGNGRLPSAVPVSRTGYWEHWRSIDASVHNAFDVEVSPFAIAIDHQGVIRAKGVVSTAEEVIDLLAADKSSGAAIMLESSQSSASRATAAQPKIL